HHARMVADFRRRFLVSLALTVPVLALAPLIQSFFGMEGGLRFPGDGYVQFGFATALFFYGGWPFLTGFFQEVHDRKPGMMTLIGAKSEVKLLLENYLRNTGNPNLKLGDIAEKEAFYEAEILTKDGSLVDKIQVHKYTGWFRSACSSPDVS
ncbi:MAG: hypothetical protein ACLFVT_01715, partial [Syntrophobacteria bacterium]